MRYLILLLLVVAGVYLWRSLARRPPEEEPRKTRVANMVRCHRCGVYLPEDEARRVGDRFYCSPEHEQQDAS